MNTVIVRFVIFQNTSLLVFLCIMKIVLKVTFNMNEKDK